MRLSVQTVRSGATAIYLDRKLIVFRKPRVFDPAKDCADNFKYAEAKCDGHRVLVHRDLLTTQVFTTQGIDISHQLLNCRWLHFAQAMMPSWSWVDGEIHSPEGGREGLKTLLAERSPNVQLSVFGCSSLYPMMDLLEAREAIAAMGFAALPRATHDGLVSAEGSYDGVVYKNAMYGDWAKKKYERTIDLAVLGIQPGKGKYDKQAGALICGLDGEVICHASGMTDEQRAEITDKDIGRVVEIKYERVGSDGGLQHPRFVCWRDDKAPEDCRRDQDPALVRRGDT